MELPENADAVNTADTLDAVDIDRIHQRTLRVVILSQILGGAGLAAGITVGALLAQEMLGSDRLAGLPTGLFTLGSALTAFLVGQSTRRFGRRAGLASGFLAGGLGAVGVLIAAVLDNPALLFVSLFIYGAGTATNLQARYAGADLAPPRTDVATARRWRWWPPPLVLSPDPTSSNRWGGWPSPWESRRSPARSSSLRWRTPAPVSCCSSSCVPTPTCWPVRLRASLQPAAPRPRPTVPPPATRPVYAWVRRS
ncbi:MFS transporter [Corynebacterium glyciniphilum]|uniref:MFS transporter n=1 Tax=Corynebacterium glyciniphilum TaxID=1404244 RepID=UPI000A906CC5|nr:MFS transporter [Corynebacterium glyciniphilum]